LETLKEFGIKVTERGGFYYFEAPEKLEGKRIVLREFSVTATENAMMFASLIKGKTKIEIAAAGPQVQNLGKFLKKWG
jgi:UDP-N-acetylglucosamine 1-carboxyvinyltransferase